MAVKKNATFHFLNFTTSETDVGITLIFDRVTTLRQRCHNVDVPAWPDLFPYSLKTSENQKTNQKRKSLREKYPNTEFFLARIYLSFEHFSLGEYYQTLRKHQRIDQLEGIISVGQ